MANNALIQGAALTGKKFLDVGGAVAAGGVATPDYKPENRVAENKAIQNRVNSYMGKMKTDMDFTSFSPSETKTMRNFLLSQRTKYTDAAKKAAEFEDTTDPNYMMYVDEMQSVNNSFTNLASQLGAYKKGKLEYAQAMQEGLYSNGNPSSQSKEAAIIYGFYDSDGDGRSEDRYDAPFQIQDGGNIAFNVGGKEITYNGMEEPFLKDTKFLNALSKTAETAYNSGASGKSNSKYAQDAYKQELDDSLQNEDTLRSIIFDFKAEADLKSIGDALESGAIDIQGAREQVIVALTQAREDAYNEGKVVYDTKSGEMTQAEKESLRKVNSKLTILDGATDGSTFIVGIGRGANNGATRLGDKYFLTDKNGIMITDTAGNGRELSKEQLAEYLNINVRGLKWLTK
jgi:hypothetical protein